MMTQPILVDLSNWKADKSYDECLKLCEKLNLIEIVMHGEHDYGRLTQDGINVLHTLMRLATYAADPDNALRSS